MSDIVTNIGDLASFIGSLTVVGGALIWIYNKFIGAPREKKRQREADKRQDKMVELIAENNEPLKDAIDRLNASLEESARDRQNLNKVVDIHATEIGEHENRLDNHGDRILVLETRNGIRTYREEYKGENK